MASFIRGKQSGMAKDLSATLVPGSFLPGEQSRYGIGSQISCATHEPVQSLLAVGTHSSKFGPGTIYVFGQARIQKRLSPAEGRGSTAGYGGKGSGASIVALQFVANRLIALDSRSELTIWDLDKAVMLARYTAPGSGVIRLVTDPMLDWAFLGLTTGEVAAYDLDRMSPAPWRIPNFWTKTRDQRARGVGLVSLQLHPRDIGQLLIGYTHGAVVYSFKQNQVLKYFEYILPPGAPGGNGGVSGEGLESLRRPRLTQALWHPTGTFILTAHEDGSLVFWDPKDGRVVMARSLSDVDVDKPRANSGKPLLLDPFARIAWCCKENPDDTALLIAGGQAVDAQEKNLTFLELGPTPIYATSTWQVLTDHFRGKRQISLPIPLGAQVVDFSLFPRSSPHFAAAQDPIAILAILSSGELVTLSFPSGYQISPTNQLHPSLSFVQPFIAKTTISTLDRNRWLGMVEKRQNGELLVKGGAESVKPRRRYEGRNIVQAAHVDGTIRIWDLGHGDEMENATQLQIDAARALGRYNDVQVTAMDLADETGEFAAGLMSGEVVVWRWGGNKYFQRGNAQPERVPNPGGLSDISAYTEPALQEGLQPFVLYEMMQGAISVVTVSDVGFVAVGSENGFFSVIDLRGPAVIFDASMADFAKQEKRSSFIRGHSSSGSTGSREWPVVIEFGVMTLDEDKYSSIACFVGTNQGRLITFKLLPSGSSYAVKFVGVTSLADRIVAICPIVADTGKPAFATGAVVAGLRTGQNVNGLLVVVTNSEVRIFKPSLGKGASKTFDSDSNLCLSANVSSYELEGAALVAFFADRSARAFSLPGLREIGRSQLNQIDTSRLAEVTVAQTGDIIGWTGPSEIVVVPVWGTAQLGLKNPDDTMINPDLVTPPRPTISNLQWLSGTQYLPPTDLDLLIGGPDRPPSKRMLAAAAAEANLARSGPTRTMTGSSSGSNPRAGTSQEGWGEYLTRQLNERTEKLNIMGDSMDNLQEQSQGWADDVSKYINKQKRNLVLGTIKSKFT